MDITTRDIILHKIMTERCKRQCNQFVLKSVQFPWQQWLQRHKAHWRDALFRLFCENIQLIPSLLLKRSAGFSLCSWVILKETRGILVLSFKTCFRCTRCVAESGPWTDLTRWVGNVEKEGPWWTEGKGFKIRLMSSERKLQERKQIVIWNKQLQFNDG